MNGVIMFASILDPETNVGRQIRGIDTIILQKLFIGWIGDKSQRRRVDGKYVLHLKLINITGKVNDLS